ncbi:M23 family metallopeptidase [Paenibacillus pini]
MRFHRGVDLVTSPSNGVLIAFVAGEVLHAKMGVTGSGFGNMGNVVAIKDDKGYLHVYAHLSAVSVKVGQHVTRGEKIGNQGNTGKSTGAHLHYEIRKKYSPSFGWTETESGVVEPTRYLQEYYKNEGIKEEIEMKLVDANLIIDKYLKPAWGASKSISEKNDIGRLADILRVASGQKPQNN